MNPFYITLYSKKPSNETLIGIMKTFYEYQSTNNFIEIDTILSTLNFNRTEDIIIISILRCNHPVKNKLANWNTFLTIAKQKYRGIDKEKIFSFLEFN